MITSNTKLIKFLSSKKFSDVIIVNKSGKSYSSHKIILSSSSTYIDTMLNFQLDKNENGIDILPFPPIPFENEENIKTNEEILMNIILTYSYSNQEFEIVESMITENLIYPLLRYAYGFNMNNLMSSLLVRVKERKILNFETSFNFLLEGIIIENNDLIEEAINLITLEMNKIIEKPMLVDILHKIPFDIFLRIVGSDEIVVDKENDICKLIIDYIKNRRKLINVKNEMIEKEKSNKNMIRYESDKEKEVDKDKEMDKDKEKEDNNQEVNTKEQSTKLLNEVKEVIENEDKSKKLVSSKSNRQINENNQSSKKLENNNNENSSQTYFDTLLKKVNLIEDKVKPKILSIIEEKQLIESIRFSKLSHKELILLKDDEFFSQYKDLIVDGMSIRLTSFEAVDDFIGYKINRKDRKYIKNENNEKNIISQKENLYKEGHIKNNSQVKEYNQQRNIIDNNQRQFENSHAIPNTYSNIHSSTQPKNIYDPIPIKSSSISFIYEYDFDQNGVFYYMGTKGHNRPFTNPHTAGYMKVFSSSLGKGQLSDLVNRELVNLRTLNEPQSYFGVDLGKDRRLIPSCYTIMNRASPSHVLLNWEFEASNDGVTYEVLDTRIFLTNDLKINQELENERNQLKEPGCTSTWGIDPHFKNKFPSGFRYFIIKNIGRNSSGGFNLAISGLEIYGIGLGTGWSIE